ncbi:Sulfhydryl oxidase 1 [Trichinella nelsoni]|uniref:Sulfhydryl oxidase n=1 Tax=Trichinella nelsoni TaxID=6336 RepID=A0A0V0SK26_9BILA|nr:Sulfhydryl oxidase 1 [Trichinella nelsoni]
MDKLFVSFLLLTLPLAQSRNVAKVPDKGLFTEEDQVDILGQTNFDKIIYNQPVLYIVLYYNRWCGHCISFAPTYKEFAQQTAGKCSSKFYILFVDQFAALDCADDDNDDLCTDHSIELFPSLKYFPVKSSSANDGVFIEDHPRTTDQLLTKLTELIVKEYKEKQHSEWPNLNYIEENTGIESLFENEEELNYVVIVFQSPESKEFLGEQLVLDSMKYKNILVRLATPQHQYAKQQQLNVPTLAIFKRKEYQSIYESPKPLNLNMMREIVRVYCSVDLTKKIEDTKKDEKKKVNNDNFVAPKEQLHLSDLKSALSYMLEHEIPMRKVITGEKLTALKNFLSTTSKYLPPEMKTVSKVLDQLVQWFSDQEQVLSKDFSHQLQMVKEENFPSAINWVTCKGSSSEYRGYPCGLWMLFHTVTVNAYKMDGKKNNFDPKIVLKHIAGYVREFFGCEECATNFGKGAAKIDENVENAEDVVLWLWRSHNRANYFLKGKPSEDPTHPKQQFPPNSLCPKCGSDEQSWNNGEVLEFLVKFYSELKMNSNDKELKEIHPKFQRFWNDNVAVEYNRDKNSWLDWNQISLCLIVWIICSSIAVLLYFMIRLLRSKFSSKSGYYKK